VSSSSREDRGVTFALRGKAMVDRMRELADRNATVRARLQAQREQAASATTMAAEAEASPLLAAELHAYQEELCVAEEELQAQIEELGRLGGALSRERRKYRELFEEAPDAYVLTAANGVVLEANTRAGHLFGVEPRFLRRKPLAALVASDHVQSLRQALLHIEPGASFEIELVIARRRDTQVWVELVAHVSRDGERIRWLARDATPRHRRSKALVGDRDDLELRVAALERALRDNEDLLARERRLREKLEAENAAKDRFLAVLSHDLRGPLNAVLGWTGLLRREHLDTKTRDKALATIERNAVAQRELIEELLDVSRIGAGKMQLEMRLLDFGDLVRKSIDAVMPLANEKQIDVADNTERAPVLVLGDASRLRQVVANLLTNALKFTPAGGRLEITLTTNGDAHLTVRDSGKGIAPAVLPFVFDRFRRSEDAEAGRNGGLGLGLYIVRHLAEMHGGSVHAESDGDGQGSAFHVVLPLREPKSSVSIPPAPESGVLAADARRRAHTMLLGRRILLVDDEQDTRELLATALSSAGALVVTVADGAAALETFDTFGPDVVVSDIGLPGFDGVELVRRLRGLGSGADVAAIAMSGFVASDDVKRALAAGYDAHVAKPFRVDDLVGAIATAQEQRDDE